MWRFWELVYGMTERDPREAEFFRLPQVSDSLVREVLQNSLDAKWDHDSQTKVKVRFTFGKVRRSEVNQYLDGLMDHLKACDLSGQDSPVGDLLSFVTIEDFGTTGLDGAIGTDARPAKGQSNFYDFWWREGISGKKETSRGRWGLGKTTLHLISKLRAFWGLTTRRDDLQTLLMGKALLKTHSIGDRWYQSSGYFTANNYKPISDEAMTQHFKEKFAISRRYNEPGLSLVIPVPDEEISAGSLLKSVIINYFYAIASDALEVELREAGGNTAAIGKSNLLDVAAAQSWEGTSWEAADVPHRLQFIIDCISELQPIELHPPNVERPEITEGIFGEDTARLRESFRANQMLSFKVPLAIKRNLDRYPSSTYFLIHIARSPQLRKADEFWIRSGVRLPDIQSLGNHCVRAMVMAEDPPIAAFLGDAENPAHTDWKENTEGFRDKYQNAPRTLRFIKRSLTGIVSILDEPPREIQEDFLREIFNVAITQDTHEEGDITKKPKMPLIISKAPRLQIAQTQGGFRVFISPENRDSLPIRATIIAGYDARRGNPFAQYEPHDFDFAKLKVNVKGGKIIVRQRNVITVEIASHKFDLRVAGFDLHRDIVVKATEQ
jgi:hypothetical protein